MSFYKASVYRGSPESHHAAAGVKIETEVEPRFFAGMNRVLTNMRKGLVVHMLTSTTTLNER
ncbi:hypothetical protein NECAME_07624 [Necator americanus]|uniref:Uncharacterized protein n=1 Tax=Necator americanus TaxID=51031 RepID=W2TLJ2_NECAM|nr:hypothetical protein NECAME_07624 [Necator americanus]ETN82970.1 hypothetical protein NECAME_07624 [Necator americanus]